MPAVLKLKNISKKFIEPRRNIIALNRINLELFHGQCIGLLGPSGSGNPECRSWEYESQIDFDIDI